MNEQMGWFVRMLDESQIMQQTLNEAIQAFHAEGGAIYTTRGDEQALACCGGTWNELSQAGISVPLESRGHRYGLFQLGQRHDGLSYNRQDEQVLRQTVDLLARTIATTRRLTATAASDADE